MDHQFLMGGSPSTGSSLLVNILDRHSAVSAGEETYLFIHPRLFTDWTTYRKYLLRTSKIGGLKSEGWFLMNGAHLLHEDYGWERSGLAQLVSRSPDLSFFADAYMSKRMARSGASVWVEKSPANVLSFPLFLQSFPRPKVIHTTRNPYDAAASLLARGQTAYQAAGAYIVQTALALRVLEHPSAALVKYEELVTEPEATVRKLLSFMGFAWEKGILQPGAEEQEEEVRMPGWLQNEKGAVGALSLGRFDRLPPAEQESLVNALALFRINPYFARRHGLRHTSLQSIAKMLDYPYREPRHPDRKSLRWQMWQDRIQRAIKAYPAFGGKYPGEL